MSRLARALSLALALPLCACDGGGGKGEVPTIEVQPAQGFVRQVRAEGYLEASEATPITAPQDSQMPMKIAWIADEGATVAKGDVVVRFDPTDMQRQLEDSLGDLDSAEISIRKEKEAGKSALTKRDQAAAQASREIESAKNFQPTDDGLLSRHELADAQIDVDLAEAKAEHASAVKEVERAATRSKVELLAIQKRQAQNEVKRAKDGLTRLEVKAENAGVFVLERGWRGMTATVGDTVWPGQKLAELPLVTDMQAALFVLEADAGDLEEGLRAEVVIEAYPDRTYPAQIERVDALAQPKHHEVPVQYFGVVLKFEATDLETMKVGQRVRATIFIEQEEALVVPRQAVFEEEGRFFVHRKSGETFERVEVELGTSSAGRVVVEKGIATGDQIALRDPDQSVDELLDVAKSKDANGEAD